MKKYAEINGRHWEASYPLCAGCPELLIHGACSYEGNGCKFPEERIKRPQCIYIAFFALCRKIGCSVEAMCDDLGDCTIEGGRHND